MIHLTEKQAHFVEAYIGVSRGDVVDAARRAGYAGDDAALERVGRRNLENHAIQEAIANRRAAVATATDAGARARRAFAIRRASKALDQPDKEPSWRSPKVERVIALGNPRKRIIRKLGRRR